MTKILSLIILYASHMQSPHTTLEAVKASVAIELELAMKAFHGPLQLHFKAREKGQFASVFCDLRGLNNIHTDSEY